MIALCPRQSASTCASAATIRCTGAGCGPFRMEDWPHDAWLRLKKNPRYYDRTLPKAERIDMRIGGDDTLQLMRFELGDVDVMSLTDLNPPDFLRLQRDRQW